MAKKHLEGLETRGVTGEMTKAAKFLVKNGVKIKDGRAKQYTPEEIAKVNKEKVQDEKQIEQE